MKNTLIFCIFLLTCGCALRTIDTQNGNLIPERKSFPLKDDILKFDKNSFLVDTNAVYVSEDKYYIEYLKFYQNGKVFRRLTSRNDLNFNRNRLYIMDGHGGYYSFRGNKIVTQFVTKLDFGGFYTERYNIHNGSLFFIAPIIGDDAGSHQVFVPSHTIIVVGVPDW